MLVPEDGKEMMSRPLVGTIRHPKPRGSREEAPAHQKNIVDCETADSTGLLLGGHCEPSDTSKIAPGKKVQRRGQLYF